MGFFEDISNTYGSHIAAALKKWSKTSKILAATRNRKVYLLQCRYQDLIPNHVHNFFISLQNNIELHEKFHNSFLKILNSFKTKILNFEIKMTLSKINHHEKILASLINQVQSVLPQHIFDRFNLQQQEIYNFNFSKIKNNQIKKINKLKNTLNFNNNDNKDYVINLTNTVIPEQVNNLLAMGPNFALKDNRKNKVLKQVITDIEYNIDNINDIADETKIEIRTECCNILTNYYLKEETVNKPDNFGKIFKETKEFIKNHEEILITKSDKSNCTVILDKITYIDSIEEQLNDNNFYKLIDKDPTTKYQNLNNKLVKQLKENNYIDDIKFKQLTMYNSQTPKLYGLPKTHKPLPIKFRPIVSCINSPSYNLAKFVNNILDKIQNQLKYNIKNSFDLVDEIKDIKVPDSHILISLDVKSLFTNVSKELVIEAITDKWQFITEFTDIPLNTFLNLVEFIFDSSYFTFNNKIYKQTFGCSMGNPASVIFANLVMNLALDRILLTLPFKIPYIKLYVDDIIAIIPENNIDNILFHFNKYNKHLEFTIELEKNKILPFLDIILIRNENGTLISDIYKKPTTSDRVLNFYSAHPLKQKINTIKCLQHRYTNLCHPSFVKKNLKILRTKLIKNNYPLSIINSTFNKKRKNIEHNNINNINKMYCKIPYIHHLSERLKGVFNKYNIEITYYNTCKLKEIFSKIKDKTPTHSQAGVVYKIDCAECNKTYIGQTKNWLGNRIKNHINDCKLATVKKERTALATHHLETGHMFDFNNTKIIDREDNYKKRIFLEMIHIAQNKNSVNYRKDIQNLNNTYITILNKFK